MEEASSSRSFLARHEFVIRRLFSLCGLVPVGAYMVVHLVTNSSLMGGPAPFQRAVYQIHSLGSLLPVVEWVFIFIPIIFHAILGVVIIRGGLPNNGSYAYGSNLRYTLQRATGLIALIFIFTHVFHLHGWLHFDWWLDGVAKPLGGAQFKPYNASSTLAAAFQKSVLIPVLYTIGVAVLRVPPVERHLVVWRAVGHLDVTGGHAARRQGVHRASGSAWPAYRLAP